MLLEKQIPCTNLKKLAGTAVLVAAMVGSMGSSAYAGKKKEEPAAAKPAPKVEEIDRTKLDTSKLVWPAPPDIGRIRYMKEAFGEPKDEAKAAPAPKKKQAWMERLAGVQQAQDNAVNRKNPHRLSKPYGVVVDSKGRVYVADTFVDAIFVFDLENNKVSFLRNGVEGRFKSVVGLAIDDDDRLFVSDPGLHQVSVFSAAGQVENVFGADHLGRPSGLAIDSKNRLLYVVDTEKEQVAVFDADSFKFLRTVGGPAKVPADDSPGVFAKPTNAAVDRDGNLYVTDTLNNRVQIFDADGAFINLFGKHGDGPGEFARPKGIAVDGDGHIWVADAAQNRVQIYDRDGHLLGYFGEGGSYPGQFGLPAGVVVDKNNRVIVSDQIQGRIQVFRYTTEAEAAALKAEREKKSASNPAPQAVRASAQ